MLDAHRFRALQCVACTVLLAAVVAACRTWIFDFDVWWHIAAGRVMRTTGWIITTDPFAFTREGLPYLATHEWLSQILLSLAWDGGGAAGVIALRTALVLCTLAVVLALAPRRVWPNGIVAVGVLGVMASGITDRPQLFSFAVFASELWLLHRSAVRGTFGRRESAAFLLLQVLWLNLHGAACVLGLIAFAAFAADQAAKRSGHIPANVWVTGILLLPALLLSPSGFGNLGYLWGLLSDQTAVFITEWQPTPLVAMIAEFWWLLALGAYGAWRSGQRVLWLIVIVVLVAMTRQASRHETFLALALVAAAVSGDTVHVLLGHLPRPWMRVSAGIALLGVAWCMTAGSVSALVRDHTRGGVGALEHGKGVAAAMERLEVRGPVFNSYELGNYLLYAGYPDRKVFVDGRNVDYGFAFLDATFRAAFDQAAWDDLERRHGFAAAAIYHAKPLESGVLPYVPWLENDPSWALAYVDDWSALYVRRTDIDPAAAYGVVTPGLLHASDPMNLLSPATIGQAEQELFRAAAERPEGVAARMTLARMYLAGGFPDDAREQLEQVVAVDDHHVAAHELLGLLAATQEDWEAAYGALRTAVRLAGASASVDTAALADIAAKAGHPLMALRYRIFGAL